MGFKTKSRAIELLGRKQIRDGTTALSELLKNSFDADAKIARTIFNTTSKQPFLFITDTGHGMSKRDILTKWLVIGTNSKKQTNKTSREGRPLMGEKGIGRLASAALGQQLFLFSKDKKTKMWNIIFIDWNVFENPYSFIDDVEIGTRLDIDFSFFNNFESNSREMINVVYENIKKESWYDVDKDKNKVLKTDLVPLYNKIKFQLENLHVPTNLLLNQLKFIENFGQGTLLLITNLYEDWGNILNPLTSSKDINNDNLLSKTRSRLFNFFYYLNRTGFDFNVDLILNNVPLDISSSGYSDEDYKIYDILIDGIVRDGIFYGKLDAKNANPSLLQECNYQLSKGLSVSDTIPYEILNSGNCGPYTVKLCHIEGLEKNTSLNRDLWTTQTEKLEKIGGVSVYRDKIRILPYGEPENDFLGLEKRRLLRAGDFPFAHRRLFGRIDITQKDNPYLEDKSSREGFIENNQFHYFVNTLKTLLVKIASLYLHRAGLGIRESLIEYNNEQFELKKNEQLISKKQKAKKRDFVKSVKDSLIDNPKKIQLYINDLDITLEGLSSEMNYLPNYSSIKKVSKLYNYTIESLSSYYYEFSKKMKESAINIPNEYKKSLDSILSSKVSFFNENLNLKTKESLLKIEEYKNKFEFMYQSKLEELKQDPQNRKSIQIEEYKEYIKSNIDSLNQQIKIFNSDLNKKLSSSLDRFKYITNLYEQETAYIKSLRDNLNNKIKEETNKYRLYVLDLENDLRKLDESSEDSIDEIFKISTTKMTQILSKLLFSKQPFEDKIESQFANADLKLLNLEKLLDNDYKLQDFIDLLTKENNKLEMENDVLTDLANTGLAAEIVDHEFNQYFTNVNNAIIDLKRTLLNPAGKYYVTQIEQGFRAISNRHSQLSPMYRSYNLKKRPIKVLNMVKDIVAFFNIKIQKLNVDIIYNIEEDSEIIISPSKIYPVLSNVLDNALYWVASKEKRLISWSFSESEQALYIEDSGPGISPNIKDEIFDRFFTLKPLGAGRGLGLTIAKKVLNMEGNDIELVIDDNIKNLSGACFKIIFKGEE